MARPSPELLSCSCSNACGWGAAWRKNWGGTAYWRAIREPITPPPLPLAILEQVGRRSDHDTPWRTLITVRRDNDIYDTDGGWFRARWHFSFDPYRDPENDSFGAMRVFNDDRLIPGAVWPLHPHRDVEGLTYVVEGTFGHEDNVGGPFGPLPAGSVQRMTLGSGAFHSELNASQTEPMRFIQIWILPDTGEPPPGVEQRVFTTEDRTDRLLKVIGPEGGDVVKVHQDASVHVASLSAGLGVSTRSATAAARTCT